MKLFAKFNRIPSCRSNPDWWCERVHDVGYLHHLCRGTIPNRNEAIIVFGKDPKRENRLFLSIFGKTILRPKPNK